jgi:hypothetical protein
MIVPQNKMHQDRAEMMHRDALIVDQNNDEILNLLNRVIHQNLVDITNLCTLTDIRCYLLSALNLKCDTSTSSTVQMIPTTLVSPMISIAESANIILIPKVQNIPNHADHAPLSDQLNVHPEPKQAKKNIASNASQETKSYNSFLPCD